MSNGLEILIVEENIAESEHLKHILEQHSHKVSVEHNGRLALAHVREHQPQIVISAVMLPEMDGYTLCREIKADEQLKNIPVILLTSLSDAADIIRGLECGADNFVTKSYDEDLLMSRIEYIVLNRELRAGAEAQVGVEVIFGGEKYSITPERQQIVDLLISTFETAVQKNLELVRVQQELNRLNERLEVEARGRTAALVEEVAERKRAEEALLANEQSFRELVNVLPIAVYACDSSGAIESYNKRAVELWGRAPNIGDLADRFCGSYKIYNLDGTHVPHADCPMAQVLLTGKPVSNEEIVIERPDGSRRTAMVSVLPRRDEQGNMAGAINCLTDITERKQAEAERDAERQLLDALVNQLPVGVMFRDVTGRHTRANQAAAMLTRIERDKLGEMNALEVIQAVRATRTDGSPLREEDIPPIIGQRGQLPVEPFEVLINPLEGATRRANISIAPVALEGQEPFGSVVVINDVTDQYSVQEQLRQSQKMESIGTMAGGVAHDFNNLLTAILGNTQLALRKLQPGDPMQPRLLEIEKAGKRAAVLTRQLLAFSRRQHLERKTINLNETIAEIIKLLQRIIGADVEVQVKYATDLSAVFADPAQIEQVIMNLGINARDAMPEGGKLTIETSNIELDASYLRKYAYIQPGKYVQISVSDTGTGMDDETQERIFEPFFTTKAVGKGTGLGLSMAYGIIKQHDGHINVHSEVGLGTTFKIFLPVDEKAVEKEKQVRQLPLLGGTETILVAEDEEALRNLARDVLEGMGYTVLVADNGEEAVEVFAQLGENIDMLLFDVVMPRMGGLEAYQRIRERSGVDVPLIFMTGYSTETVQSRFVNQNVPVEELGATVIQKPYSVEGLGRKVRGLLDSARRK